MACGAVAGLAAAVQTTRHNSKRAELESTERFLKSFLHSGILGLLGTLGVIEPLIKEKVGTIEMTKNEVDALEEMVSKAVDLGKEKFGVKYSSVLSSSVLSAMYIAWIMCKSVEDIMHKHPDLYSQTAIDKCVEMREGLDVLITQQTNLVAGIAAAQKQAALTAPKANHAATPAEDEDFGAFRAGEEGASYIPPSLRPYRSRRP